MLLFPKLTSLTLGISRLSLYWLQTILLVTLNLNISFTNDEFIKFILLQISKQKLLNLLAFIVTLPDFAKSVSYGDS